MIEYMWLEYNQLSGIIPENICDLPIDWSGETLWGDDVIKLSNNNFCPPPPECIEDYVGEQDTSNCE